MGQEEPVNRQRGSRWKEGHVAVGEQLATSLEEAGLLRMACERHPVPRHEKRPRCRDHRIAGGISTVQPPLVGASAGSTGRGPGKPLQPGDRASGRMGITTRASAASCTKSGAPDGSLPNSRTSSGRKTNSFRGVAPLVVNRTSRPGPWSWSSLAR